MRLKNLIKRYETFIGKNNFELRNLADLQYIHDIDYKEISGFETLAIADKEALKIFLVRFFNAWGLEARSSIVPIRVHAVLKRWYWIKHPKEENISIWIKEEHIAIDSTGKELFKIYESIEEEYLTLLHQSIKQEEIYLRFEYKSSDSSGWIHIIEGGYGWY